MICVGILIYVNNLLQSNNNFLLQYFWSQNSFYRLCDFNFGSDANKHYTVCNPAECKCDMIKGNELDVGNIDFELQAKVGDKCLNVLLFLNIKELISSLQPDVPLRCNLDKNVAF